MALREAKANVKIACLDFNSNFAVFAKSKLAVVETQEISLINKHFWIEYILHDTTHKQKSW